VVTTGHRGLVVIAFVQPRSGTGALMPAVGVRIQLTAINALMGSKPEARFRFIQERAAFAQDLDI
jgi:hypothetical protein